MACLKYDASDLPPVHTWTWDTEMNTQLKYPGISCRDILSEGRLGLIGALHADYTQEVSKAEPKHKTSAGAAEGAAEADSSPEASTPPQRPRFGLLVSPADPCILEQR